MKLNVSESNAIISSGFSAQPRADGDEAISSDATHECPGQVSVLNREPMGMKRRQCKAPRSKLNVSVLNREPMGMKLTYSFLDREDTVVSVLNREPMGMKHNMP